MKIAAIDIGSNAIRLLIEEIHLDGSSYYIEKVSLTRVPVRLGEDVFTKGKISKEKMRQLVKTMRAFWYLMDVHHVEYFRACATSAMRESSNKKEVLDRVEKEANVSIEILSGDEEANLIFENSFVQNLNVANNYLYIDVGGGSTELTLIKHGKRIKGKSFEIGTVRMLNAAVSDELWEKAGRWIQSALEQDEKVVGIGTGGNINTIFKNQGKKMTEVLSYKELQEQYDLLRSYSYEQRITKLKLKPDRADVIIPACEIYLKIARYAGIQEILVPKIGLADGIILDIFNNWKKTQNLKVGAVAN